MSNENRVDAHCIEVTEIAAVLDLPAGDPVRRHVETCPRCRSLVASYQSFVEAAPVAGADLERVRGMLDARIRADASHWKPAIAPARAFPWQKLLRPMPLLAAGLVVIAAAAFWTSSRQPEQSSLRESAPQAQAFALNAAQVAADGTIHLSWSAMTGADQYQVRLYGPDFGEIYRSPNTSETALTVDRTALPANLPPTLDLTWRVFARSQGDVIATSAPGSIRTR
jgi:hypothetical protein